MAVDPRCNIISDQLRSIIDRAQQEAAELQQTTRAGRDPGDGGIWRTDDLFPFEFGGPVAPLQKAEWISTLGYVANGSETGAQLAGLIQRFQHLTDVRSRRDLTFLKRYIGGLRKDDYPHLMEVLEQRTHELDADGFYKNPVGSTRIVPGNERVANAAAGIRAYFEARAKLAEQKNLEGFTRYQFYAPEMYKTSSTRNEAFQRRAREGLAKQTARKNGRSTPIAEDYAEAKSVFDHYISPQYSQVAHNVQKGRFIDFGEDRITDPYEYLSMYAQQFWKAINSDDIFGRRASLSGRPAKIGQLLGQLEIENGSNRLRQAASALVDDTLGITPSDPFMNHWIMRSLGSLQTLKLTLSTIKNATQTLNTTYYTSFRDTLKAVGSLIGNVEVETGIPAREFAGMMASVIDNGIYEASLFQHEGFIGEAGQKLLKYNGFTGVEIMNRAIAGTAGAFNAVSQAKAFARTGKKKYATQLIELGLNPEKVRAQNGILTLEEKLVAGQRTIDVTQGRARLSELPVFTSTNQSWGRALLTFKTFSINQTKMMIDGSRRNSIRTVMYGAGVMPLAGMGVNFLYDRGLEEIGVPPPKYKEDQDGMAQYLEGMASAGGFGLISDAFYAAYRAGGPGGTSFRGTLTTPILSTLEDTLIATGHLMRMSLTDDPEVRDQSVARFGSIVGRQFGGLGSAFVRYNRDDE